MTQPTRKIFISYRQADNADFVYRIRDWLIQRYGREHVFMDFDNLPAFTRFEDYIKTRISESDAVLAIIGPDWLPLLQAKAADDDRDYVRIELETALSTPTTILAPVCIKGAGMPNRRDLPESLRPMCDINAARLDGGKAFYDDIERLMRDIESILTRTPAPSVKPKPSAPEVHDPPLGSAAAYVTRAKQRNLAKDYDGAIADSSEAIRLDPTNTSAYANRGFARNAKGDFDGAIADASEAIRLDYTNTSAYNNRGFARRAKGDFDGAIADYNEAIRLEPTNVVVYNNRGVAYENKGMYAQANADYHRYIELGNLSDAKRKQVEDLIRDNEAKIREQK